MTTTIKKTLQEEIIDILKDENKNQVIAFAAYMQRLLIDTDKDGKLKNPFMKTKSAKALSDLFLRVQGEGLVFDGKHITLLSRGISYDYIAYKNKMLLAYPESMIDMDVVKEGDTFTAGKESGKVVYSHKIADAMSTANAKSIIGAYCVIKNKRGEFLTVLSKEDIEKHQKVAKTNTFWAAWFKEMVLKTVIKKAAKYHFDDIFEGMNEEDNKEIDLEKVLPEVDHAKVDEVIKKIEGFTNLKDLQNYYVELPAEFIKNGDVFEAYTAQKNVCKAIK